MKAITIIGGGIAGLSLGILLRRQNVPVALLEAGCYPRHRVCGEFISGPGQSLLGQLLPQQVLDGIVLTARTGQFHLNGKSSPVRALPIPAICVSRFDLDNALAKAFLELGGNLHTETRVRIDQGCEAVVRATGRQPHTGTSDEKWIGLKAHAKGVRLDADLEMFAVDHGYVGVCRLRGDVVNICGLLRNSVATQNSASPHAALLGRSGSLLHERMKGAQLLPGTLCSVAGMFYKKEPLPDGVSVGDASGLIPPVTGNGMSLAMESADLVSHRILDFCRGRCSWAEVRGALTQDFEHQFGNRMAWGRLLHRSVLSPVVKGFPAGLLLHSSAVWNLLFSRTRA